MTPTEAAKLIDKPVYHYDWRCQKETLYILRGIKKDKKTGRPYAALQDRNIKNSYLRARLEDIRGGE